MQYKKFGGTGLDISVVSLGTWAMGSDYFGKVNDDESIQAIHAALDAGINLIDTAPAYGAGHSEEVVGKALEHHRDRAVISTKVGSIRLPGKFVRDLTPDGIRKQLHESLTRLKTDCIDIYLLHWPDENVALEQTSKTIAELKKAGKFRFFGVSNFSLEQIDVIEQYVKVDVLQPQYSILARDKEPLIEACAARGIAVMSYGSLAGGILSGKYKELPKFDEADTRSNFYPFFKEPLWGKTQQLLRQLEELAERKGRPVSEVAVNFAAQHPSINTALAGAKNPQQAKANAAAADWTLSSEEREHINRAFHKLFDDR